MQLTTPMCLLKTYFNKILPIIMLKYLKEKKKQKKKKIGMG
jgi:hypothetical protein